jgi:O-acetylhomoserine (thiol)-lyase
VVPLRNIGAAISPFNAWLILQGIETLALRMDRICDNTLAVAQYLKKHAKVGWVNYAGLPDHPDHALAQEVPGRQGFGPADLRREERAGAGREAGARFLDACSSSRGWSTSATPRAWPRTRPPPRTASCHPPNWPSRRQ